MKEKKTWWCSDRIVFLVQLADAFARRPQQRIVLPHLLLRRIREIRQKRELKIAFGITEVMDFQPLQILLKRHRAREERGHHHQRPKLFRDCPRENPFSAAVCGPSESVTKRLTKETARSEAGNQRQKRKGGQR